MIRGIIVDGKYQKKAGIAMSQNNQQVRRGESSQYHDWRRDRQSENHRRDIIQPRKNNGEPNSDFIRAYPKEAQQYFNKEELRQYE